MSYKFNQSGARAYVREHAGPPWTCMICAEPIMMRGQASASLNVHHVDEDTSNNAPGNLVPVHFGCHISEHMKERWKNEEWRAKMSAAVAESNVRRGPTKGFAGRRHSEETKRKMREAQLRRTA